MTEQEQEQEQEYQEFLEEQRRLEEMEHYAVGIDEDILQDDLIRAIVGEISDDEGLLRCETTNKEIPPDSQRRKVSRKPIRKAVMIRRVCIIIIAAVFLIKLIQSF